MSRMQANKHVCKRGDVCCMSGEMPSPIPRPSIRHYAQLAEDLLQQGEGLG